ncbi:MAG: substrate-binding domain-containing protein [Desulfovibrionaceae bacterium]
MFKQRKIIVYFFLLSFTFFLYACSNNDSTESLSRTTVSEKQDSLQNASTSNHYNENVPVATKQTRQTLVLATTTSLNDTGIIDHLSAELKKEKNIELKWVSVGTGKALAIGKNCDADLLIVHAPEAEKNALQEGYISERIPFMTNSFVIIGPKRYKNIFINRDTKGFFEAKNIDADGVFLFISRGDNSGTHKKELSLWENAGITIPKDAKHYIETGQGMLQTILMANEKLGFTLTDKATWLYFLEKHPTSSALDIVVDKGNDLENIYSILLLSKEHCNNVQDALAREVATWLISKETQKKIQNYSLNETALFMPLYPDEMPKK